MKYISTDDWKQSVRERVQALDRGFTTLADELEVDYTTLTKMLSSKTEPRLALVLRIEDVLGKLNG